jgi:hypothetical protein
MTEWVPGDGDSPDRVDALVHGLTALSGASAPMEIAAPQKGRNMRKRDTMSPLATWQG